MKVDSFRLLILTICLILKGTNADTSTKRQQCHDFIGDISNCQRFVRCFHNLRVLFTCPSATYYVPELKTCVAKELVHDCDDSKNRIEITVNPNSLSNENEDYPTIEADLNALEIPMQKSLSSNTDSSSMPKQFGCSSFCYNQGVCVLVGQAITCRCAPGFIGVRCQVAQSAISTRARCDDGIPRCENGAQCVDVSVGETYVCVCTPGWAGDFCDTPDTTPSVLTTTSSPPGNACPINPCLNGASCVTLAGGGFRCVCVGLYTGLLCDSPTSGIGPGIGVGCGTPNPCLNSGLCVPSTFGNQCQCASGYTGSYCQTSTAVLLRNYCLPNPCQNGGSCYLNGTTSFACACRTGYGGTCCEITLAAANPCLTTTCYNGGTCQVIAANTFRCVCPFGYLGVQCEQRICDPNPCLYGGNCIPIGNTYQCICPPQYTGRCCELLQLTTAAPNPCNSQPCLNGGTCTRTSSTDFVCSCTASYYGRCCELRNYCQPNPCYNGGTCVSTMNAYICQCTYPNSGSNCELRLATQPPQPTCACILCPCPTPVVTATNPCLPNPCQNNGGCSVVQNTAQCYCQASFTGYYCQFTRKRSLSNSPCNNVTCLNGGVCYTDEQGPHCTCPKPYFGDRCELINRPRACHPSPCGKNGQCITTKEGHKCICKNGTTGVLCEQILMPPNYRWCPLDCPSGATCVYEGSIPKCRILSVY